MKSIFKDSLLGYSKKDVCRYIAEMNEDFSRRLLEKDQKYEDTLRELQEAEKENERLRELAESADNLYLDFSSAFRILEEKMEACHVKYREAQAEFCKQALEEPERAQT